MSRVKPKYAVAMYNVEAERALLARVIADEAVWWEVADRLMPEDFSEPHRPIFQAMQHLAAQGRQIMQPALLAQLGETQDEISMTAYLAGLRAHATEPGVRAAKVGEYLDLILHRSTCRHLLDASDAIRMKATEALQELPGDDLRGQALKLVADNDNTPNESEKLGDVIARVITHANDAATGKKVVGIRTGLRPFDDLVGAMLPGQLIIIGGETSSGKTALGVQIAYMLGNQGIPVDITSKEMEAFELGARVLATLAEVSSERIVEGQLEPADLDKMMLMGDRALDVPVWINDKTGQTVGMIGARLARQIARHGIKAAVIDHLQYVRPDNSKRDEREQIAQVIDDLKALAKRQKIVMIVLSHVSRASDIAAIRDASDIKRPALRDLYGSSAIEKAADAVVFVHRPAWFLERATPPAKYRASCEADKLTWEGRAELVLPKRRGGRGFGVRQCEFDEQRTWFS